MNDKIKNITISILFFSIFTVFFFLNVLSRDNEISNSERRKLKQFPKLSWNNIIDTKFMDDFDKYVLDQFVFRDVFRQIKTQMEFDVLNKRDNNDLFIRDGFIFKKLYPLNKDAVLTTAKKMNNIYEKYLKNTNVYYTIIPDKNYYLEDSLGYLKIDYNELVDIMNKNIDNMKYINIFDTLTLDSYYKTDIHWKQNKIYCTALKVGNSMKFSIANNYDKKAINNFKGSYFGQMASIKTLPENITYLTNDMLDSATVFNYEANKSTSIYDLDKKENADKYDIFLSGPSALLEIDNPKALTNKELIVFRDSFGSSLIPLLIQDYKKVTIIDIRYIKSDTLGEYVKFDNQDVLFMYSVNIINNGSILK